MTGHVPAAKTVPPAPPPGHVERQRLYRKLNEARGQRLITVVAGAGFGKSTLLATWALDVRAAWYTVDAGDRALSTFVRGLVTALRPRMAHLPPALRVAAAGALGPDADERTRAEAIAAALAEALDARVGEELVIVLDDIHELQARSPSARLVETLCRHGPAGVRLVLASRTEPPFALQRLRGRGEVLTLDPTALAFTEAETAALLQATLGPEGPALAEGVQELTGGWPAAVRLTVGALRGTVPADRQAALQALRRPGGPLFAYLAEEVIAAAAPAARELIRRVAPLERFTVDLAAALGVTHAQVTIAALEQHGFLLEQRDVDGWYSLHGLVREAAGALLPLTDGKRQEILRTAAHWLADHGRLQEALRCLDSAGEPTEVARLLATHGADLLAAGAVAEVAEVSARLPPAERTPDVELILGQARQVLGDWEGALSSFHRAAGGQGPLPAALAWRIGLIHHFRGDLSAALAVYEQGQLEGASLRDQALLLAWSASASWLRGDADACRQRASAAFAAAQASGDLDALAAAHTVLAMLAALEGDRRANDAHYLRALDAAERAGNVLHLLRIHTNRGSRSLEEGAYEEAIAELDLAIRLAELTGYAALHGLALANRGEAQLRLGRLEEAVADYEAARALHQRIGSAMVSYPLRGLGDVYRERGELALARAAYEEALTVAERSGDPQGLVAALAGLARVLAGELPEEAARLAERAVGQGPGMSYVAALLAAGWVALARGGRHEARTCAARAETAARRHRDRAGVAEAIELQALAAAGPDSPAPEREHAAARLDEAAGMWHELGSPIAAARAEFAAARLATGPDAGARAAAAMRRLRELGVRPRAAEAAGPLLAVAAAGGPDVAIHSLGGFRVLRDGTAVSLSEWQSKKARDLLKMLVARRGRPTRREMLMDALWPDEDPERLANRLSVLLSTVRAVLDPGHRHGAERFVAADRDTVGLNMDALAVDVEDLLAGAATGLGLRRAGQHEEARPILEAAEAAYAGDFLEEDPYEDWAVPLREEARAAAISVARALAEDAIAARDADLAARYLLRILERDPYDEGAHLSLVAALAEAGRHGEARRRYQVYATRMTEIGVESAPFPTP